MRFGTLVHIIYSPYRKDNLNSFYPNASSRFRFDRLTIQKNKLTPEAFAIQKEQYMSTGDAKLLLYALNNLDKDPIVITEETMLSNDGKVFKKLPAICEILQITGRA